MLRRLAPALLALLLAAPAAQAAAPTATTAPTRTVDAAGVKLAYRSVGTGRPLVLVQGLGSSMDAWDPVLVDTLARGGHRVIVFDNEGMGRSKQRRGMLTVRRMAEDTAALIRKLQLGRPDVLGYSMGGMTAQALAVRHPRRVRRLVLAATAPGDGKATSPDPDALEALTGPLAGAGLLSFLFPKGQAGARNRYIKAISRRKGVNPVGPDVVIQQQIIASGQWLTGNDSAGRQITALKLPVLVAGGRLDRVLPYPNQRHLADVIPKARFVPYGDASHGFLFQHAHTFATTVNRFLR